MANRNSKGPSVGSLIAGLAAAGAALGYYFYGPDGERRRKKVRGWMVKAKGEVLSELENMKEVSQDSYNATVDRVTAKYGKAGSVGKVEAQKLGKELKKHWENISKELCDEPKKKTRKKTTKKTAAKTSKKTAKKSTAKKATAKKTTTKKSRNNKS